ncbi:mitochondrial ribosomal small subunit component [Moesziomyces antarcticus]|uniref:Mitochondrial ribosomal small subunit component n=2 Tax=Pseudozyma antarctica TaxID=84753 RepID=A0A081CBY2_PSEA2|nr:mitochondrial ribosomal small subunit component [Moesziomyces antarcticus]GAK64178.1 mitochondrial ribosomal small subunit component [Moesziomyces antarcticus]SPO44599.1 related to RSM24 - mitochondrial ribosomal protein of the small subunit [Moesziomyces antarcticus]
MSVALGSSSIRTASAAAASSSRSALNPANGSTRAFSASASAAAKPRKQRNSNDPMALRKMGKFNYDDVPTLGHLILQRKRETLQLLRTIEFEIPKLAGMRQAYKPPTTAQCVQYRFQHYQGEKHPASRKVVLNVSVDALANAGAVKDEKSRHKLLLLAGSRFHPTATPATSQEQPKGDIKISCELFPNERQNMKWCSDTLDALIKEANVRTPDVDALPLDPRASLIRQDKKRHYLRADRPTLKHFPKHWL